MTRSKGDATSPRTKRGTQTSRNDGPEGSDGRGSADAVRGMLPKEAREAQRQHPAAWWSLLAAMLTPLVIGITAIGMLLKHLFPSPNPLLILAGGGLLSLAIPPLMLLGAFGWLLLARRFVPRAGARAFFIHPGFGILSRIDEWMFVRVYGKDHA